MTRYIAEISRIIYSSRGLSYELTAHLVDASGPVAKRTYLDDKRLCEALEQLGISPPQQERIVSVLHSATGRETVPLDISEEVFGEFYRKKRYQVIGCDGPSAVSTHHLAEFDAFENAENYRKSAELEGWERTAVLDRNSDEIVSPAGVRRKSGGAE